MLAVLPFADGGLLHRLMGESERSREVYDTARILLEEEAKKRPDDHRVHSSLGIVYAGLGRKKNAVREGKLGVELFAVSKDAYIGPYREEGLAARGGSAFFHCPKVCGATTSGGAFGDAGDL